jgi:hypothetical protein
MSNSEIITIKIGPKFVQFRYFKDAHTLIAIDQSHLPSKSSQRVFSYDPQNGRVNFFETESEKRNAQARGSTW